LGEGRLTVNGRDIAHIDNAKDRRKAFRAIKKIAERYVETHMSKNTPLTLPAVKAKLLEGKKGLIVGIANENSIAWGCAKAFRAFGAEVAVTYLNDKAKKYVEPLARALESPIVLPLDVNTPGQMEAVFERIAKEWGKLDFVVHSIAFSPKDALQGRVVDVSREGFAKTMDVSCWTFIRMAHLAEPMMRCSRCRTTAARWWLRTTTSWASPKQRLSARSATSQPSSVREVFAFTRSLPGPSRPGPHPGFRNSMRCSTRRRRKRPHVAW
jgi:enoyl-[acyl-carrier protein] reductase I